MRPSHAANEGRIFSWDNPPPTGHPGEGHGCRCWAEPYYGIAIYDPPIEPIYPELLILPLLRMGRLVTAWRTWTLQRSASRNWQLSPTKSPTTWRNRIERGNWTPEKISDTIKTGKIVKVRNERTGQMAARYEKDGTFVVRDDSTGSILQLSGKDFTPKHVPPGKSV